ncbi:MAG: NAD-glutamate dehydrogenase domain-containing protein, partial [Pseudomonadota bacterium]
SDTANGIAQEHGFWLDDAFASGGSAGYDHKDMGITARGAWEAVKRHFREIGKDIQSEAFTVAGVGDMSGDVFGNGMLLSRHIRLVAAFDHRDIFIDPNPDAETSFAERERMFGLKRSSWADYDKALISKGGGVFSRKSKSIAISAEMRKLLGLTEKRLPPNDLIKAILRAPVELFWLGGIGTYFKGDGEEDWRVGDRANDLVRVTASEIRASVIGEGANLGVTQTARIEFAARGGRVNTDAIDNSAGVDSSDHEVNIKILLSKAIENGALEADARNALLEEMTDAVARHVLAHNYQQTRALSQRLATAPADLDSQARLMAVLEKTERLDRALENLPDTEAIATLRGRNQGLTRPEISVLLAYAKNWLFEELVASSAPDDPVFERELFAYFPERLAEFRTEIATHPLRREIIATRIANDIVDSCGPSFPYRAADATGADFGEITLAYEAARRILDLRPFVAAVDGLDNKIDATCQLDLYNAASTLLREQMYRIAAGVNTGAVLEKEGVSGFLEAYGGPVSEIKTGLADVLPPRARKTLDERRAQWIELGAPDDVGVEAALMPSLELVFDVANLSRETGWAPIDAAAMFFAVGEALSIDVVRAAARDLPRADYYDKMALRRLAEDLATRQSGLTASLIEGGEAPSGAPGEWTSTLIGDWRDAHSAQFERYDRFIVELEIERGMSVGKLSLLNRKLVDLEERVRLV